MYGNDRDDTGDDPDEEESRSVIIRSVTEFGAMIDFLRANTFVSKEEYQWSWSVPQIKLASSDFTYTKYLSEKQAKKYWAKRARKEKVYDDPDKFINDLGLPMFD